MGWFSMIRGLLMEALYPAQANCMGCGSPAGACDGWLCSTCADILKPVKDLSGPRCPRCGRPLGEDVREGRACRTCGDWPQGLITAARFAYPYRRPVKGMIRRMKYQGVTRMADWMAEEMLRTVTLELPGSFDVIVPVPMHKKRLKQRGVNQAAALARVLSYRSGVPCREALRRVRDTTQQARLSAPQRRRNLEGAFAACEDLRGHRVLLVDDVITTGATALSCARALRLAGAEDVLFIALAGAIDQNPPQQK